jgi:small subunit ribosomal protein S19
MSRAKWKGPFVPNKILDNLNSVSFSDKNEITTYFRKSAIVPQFIGLTFNIHNGKTFSKVKITETMVGKKLGEFSPTRKRFSFKKKKSK